MKPDLSVIIASFNTKKLLKATIDSVIRTTRKITYEIIVVDNASKDSSLTLLKDYQKRKDVFVIANKTNVGFGRANNQGMRKAKGRYILLLNSDTLIKQNVLGKMVSFLDEREDIGIASCALKNRDGSLQGTGGYFPTLFRVFSWMTFLDDIPGLDRLVHPFHPMHPKLTLAKGEKSFKKAGERDWLTGAFLLMRKEVYREAGDFDQDYFMYVEEVDYCFRAKKYGWKIWYKPDLSIIHYGGASGTKELPILSEFKGLKIFYQKHMPAWQYPLLRFLLKGGAFLRLLVFGLIEGRQSSKIYFRAMKEA